jgi:hypothetical protein
MEYDIKYLNAEEAVDTANLDLDIKKEEYVQVCTLERKKNKGNPGEGVPAASESLGKTGSRSCKACRHNGNSECFQTLRKSTF